DENEKEIKTVNFEDFIELWIELIMIDWYDVPEEDAIITDFKPGIFIKKPSYLVSDASSVEIIIFENDKPKKMIRTNALEIASEGIRDINNYFEKFLPLF
ncbi:MAG: hypothetical protein Q8R05_07130, partial [Candidatus Omnitrophota bacterium]|nr:hypothetical protein [Candidatus Omnitrophota bacterium]